MVPMKDFVYYTAARLLVFFGTFAAVWLVTGFFLEFNNVVVLWVLLISLLISSAISIFALAPLRDKLAIRLQHRAESLKERVEESRRAEDID